MMKSVHHPFSVIIPRSLFSALGFFNFNYITKNKLKIKQSSTIRTDELRGSDDLTQRHKIPCQIKLILFVSSESLYKDTSPPNHKPALSFEPARAPTGHCIEKDSPTWQTAKKNENRNNGFKKNH